MVALRFNSRNLIIRRAGLFPGVYQDAQLHVIGSVKTLQPIRQGIRVGHLTRFQFNAVRNIPFPGMAQAIDDHIAGLAFQQADMHHTFVNPLRRQVRLADGVPFFLVNRIDGIRHVVQILQGNCFSGILIRNFFYFFFC